jgi:oligopeptide/dipeptide ABC transporter ATP-binding protein
MALLEVQDLQVWFESPSGRVNVVNDACFDVHRGETLALVGESGSGKTATANAILRLRPQTGKSMVEGRIAFDGVNLADLDEPAMRRVRGRRIAMIFQEPMTALNPVMTIGAQIVETIRLHQPVSRRQAWVRAVDLLGSMGVPTPRQRVKDYPHQLSGGMRQRAMIAMAVACEPDLLIADEPTTALDVTTQVQVLDLLRDLRERLGMALLLISHDLAVVAQIADRVMIMYAGRIVESSATQEVFKAPRHPYTDGLLAIASLDRLSPGARLPEIKGTAPSFANMPPGCSFAPRCPSAAARCVAESPAVTQVASGAKVACLYPIHSPVTA